MRLLCSHQKLLPGIRRIVPEAIEVLTQGEIVATRLADWLARHPEHETRLTRGGSRRISTTDDPAWFAGASARFLGETLDVGRARLRPVALAALTTVLGMLPLVTDAFYAAMAVTIMCGLTFATVLTMVVIPVNYAIVYRIPNPPQNG